MFAFCFSLFPDCCISLNRYVVGAEYLLFFFHSNVEMLLAFMMQCNLCVARFLWCVCCLNYVCVMWFTRIECICCLRVSWWWWCWIAIIYFICPDLLLILVHICLSLGLCISVMLLISNQMHENKNVGEIKHYYFVSDLDSSHWLIFSVLFWDLQFSCIDFRLDLWDLRLILVTCDWESCETYDTCL